MNISIIGTSKITEAHIKTIQKNKSKVIAISSTRKNSRKITYFAKKFRIKNVFKNWKENIKFTAKIPNARFLITCRIQDNKKVLELCCKTGKKILIEKPVFLKKKEFKIYQKYNNKIFVGYNRIFYKNINFLKKEIGNLKNINVLVKCPESSVSNITKNSCHIISVLMFLFGKMKFLKRIKFKNYINCTFNSAKNVKINVFFNIKNSDNFSIEIFNNKKRYLLAPIENLRIFSKVKLTRYKSNNLYKPIIQREYNEFNNSNLKPGFDQQFKAFKNFALEKRKKIINNLTFAEKICEICNKITK